MIESIIVGYLQPILNVPVSTMHQVDDPDMHVIVERVGGGSNNRIRNASIAIQSYALTMYEAAQLHEAVIAAMDNIVMLDSIGGVSLNAEYNYTDEDTKKPRYQAVFDVVYY